MKINILLCDTFPGLLPPEIPSYTAMFTRLFDRCQSGLEYEVFNAFAGELPEIIQGSLYLITGCNQSVYDDTPWIKALLSWIVQADAAKAKLTGICFGHQAVAAALGGRVIRAPQGWGMGLRQSRLLTTDGAPFVDETVSLLYNHHDQVVKMPPEARCLVSSAFCPIEAMAVGRHILTFQGHPEYTAGYERHLLLHHSRGEDPGVIARALDSVKTDFHQGPAVAQWILRFYEPR